MELSWSDVFAFRMRRQHLDPRTDRGVPDVVGRLCGVQAQVASAAGLAVALRRTAPDGDTVDRRVADLSLVKTWAMRGTLHLLRPEDAGTFLSLVETSRFWTKPSWQRASGVTPDQVDALTEKVAELLDGVVLTRDELVARLVADPRFADLEHQLRSGWGQVLKPLAWRGVLCHGPNQGTKVTFTLPAGRYPGWTTPPDPDAAAPTVIAAYLGAYGPATPEAFDQWLTRNSTSKPRLRRWFGDMGDALTEVDVDGRRALAPTALLDELADPAPPAGVRLLGGFDQYVLGPGTGDEALLPTRHRGAVSRTSGWISPVVVVDGRVAGVWEVVGDEVVVSPFPDGTPLPRGGLEAEVAHVARASGRERLALRVG